MKVETNPNKTNIEITSGQSCVKFNTREQTTEVIGIKTKTKGPSAEWEWNLKEDKTNKVQTIDENSTSVQYPSAKAVYDAFQDIPGFLQKQSDWDQTDSSKVDYIKNKPSIPAAQVNADWNAQSGVSEILNKPVIPVVPTDVSTFTNDAGYITLSDVPTQVQSDWSQSDNQAVDYIKNKPSIPAAQVNSNWNSSSGVSEILNKPDLTLKEDKSNKVTSISSSSTDTQYPSAKAVYDAIPTALPVLIKYVRVDSGTDYTIPDEPAGTMYAISIADGIGTVTIHATSGTWLHWKSDGCRNFYPGTGTGSPEVTTSMTDSGGGTRTVNLFIRMH